MTEAPHLARIRATMAAMAEDVRRNDPTLQSIAALPEPAVPLFVIDTETTAFCPAGGGIVEIGCVAVHEGVIVGAFESYVWPGYANLNRPEHWQTLAKCSGISPARLLDAPDLAETLDELHGWAMGIDHRTAHRVTSFNVGFDRAFLDECDVLIWQPCLMRRAQAALGLSRYPSLARACEAFGIAREAEHRALADARAAALLHLAMEGLK